MDIARQRAVYDTVLVYQVPFCKPFWKSVSKFSNPDNNQLTLWEILPNDCKTSSNIVAAIACLVVIFSVFIHLATIVAFSSLKDEVLERVKEYNQVGRNMRRRERLRRTVEPSIIKEAADFAYSMQTQNRLRRSLAFIGMMSSALLLPLLLASTSEVYSSPFSLHHDIDFRSKMANYSLAISALFHLTLAASLSTFLLMTVERIRETMRMCPNDYFKPSFAEADKAKFYNDNADFERASNFPPRTGSVKSDYKPWRNFLESNTENTMVPEAALIYSFRESYSLIDLITVLLVPATSAIVTTISLAVFRSRFEVYGISVTSTGSGSFEYIPGILSYDIAFYPNIVYFYAGTIGVLIVLVIAASIIAILRSQDMLSTAKHVEGYEKSVNLYEKSNNRRKNGRKKKNPSILKTGPDSVRLARRRRWDHKSSRQDPDGLSISRDEIDEEFESSISNIPLPPPPPIVRNSFISLDDLSLPPPPRPESILELPKPLHLSPSLPSVLKDDHLTEVRDLAEEQIAVEKTRAFFANIRQSRISLLAFYVTFAFLAPTLILFTAGIFYPHDTGIAGIMGGNFNLTNATSGEKSITADPRGGEGTIESSTYADELTPPPFTVTSTSSSVRTYEERLSQFQSVGDRRNWVTTLSATFLILYTLAGTAPFFTFYISSPRFKKEVKRFCSFLLCCKWKIYREEQMREDDSVRDRSRTNRGVAMRSQSVRSRSTFYQGSPRSRTIVVPQRAGAPLRREQTIAAPRYVSWELREAM